MKATRDEILTTLKEILINNLNISLNPEEIDENESLFEGGFELDSVDMLEIVAGVDEKYNIALTDKDSEYFENLNKLSSYIESKITD
ncbi:phosphopantetheine-binding protein [Ruminococcus sp. YE282]|uniref:acyl carrier protein n=1 Tax=Ruminococcus sp. YE282 TaxID=3158780 RepID=UPI00087F385A|nr:acyl carrier protein [Ruminococcus bromii]